MVLQFTTPADVRTKIFLGLGDTCTHLHIWTTKWADRTPYEWIHLFIHALVPIPNTWYLDPELHQQARHWEILKENFLGTFGLIGGKKMLDEALHDIDAFIFRKPHPHTPPVVLTWGA